MMGKFTIRACNFVLLFFGLDEIKIHAQTFTPPGDIAHLSLGNTAWMLVATALVMLMTIPGLDLFYGGLVISILSSLACYIMVGTIKFKFKYDDSLDAFGVQGIGGIVGSLLVGVLATPMIQPPVSGAWFGNVHQLWIQALAVIVTIIFSGGMSWILFIIIEKLIGIRATEEEEAIGLDLSQHEVIAYTEVE